MIPIGQFLTPYAEPNAAAGASQAIQGIGMGEQRKLDRERMAQQNQQFLASQKQEDEHFNNQLTANVITKYLEMGMPILQKHADLVSQGTEESLAAARQMEAQLGAIGFHFGPPDEQKVAPSAGIAAPPIAQQKTPAQATSETESEVPKRAQPKGKPTPLLKAFMTPRMTEEEAPSAAEPPEEVRRAVQEENARNYGPLFRNAPAFLPPPGAAPEPPPPAEPQESPTPKQQAIPSAAQKAPKKGKMKAPELSVDVALEPPAAPAASGPSPYSIFFMGNRIGTVDPAKSRSAMLEAAKRQAAEFTAGTDPEFRPLIQGLLDRAKSPQEVEELMKLFGSPEVMHLIGERAARSAAYAKAQRGSGRADTLDYMSGVTLFEKSLTDQSLKNYTESWRGFNEAASMLRSGNPIASVAVSRGVAKAMNGPGVMTDQDAQAPTSLLPWREKIIAWVQGRAVGDLPEEIKQQFGDYLRRKAEWLEGEVRQSYQNFVAMMRDYGPPSDQATRAAIGQAKQFYSKFGVFNPKDFGMSAASPKSASPPGKSVSVRATGKDAGKVIKTLEDSGL